MKTRFTSVFTILLLAMFLVACGAETDSDVAEEPIIDESETSDELTSEDLDGDIPVQVTITDSAIEMPSEVDASVGQFTVENRGEMEHGFTIRGNNVSESLDQPIQPGEVMTMDVSLAPGEYTAMCEAAGIETSFTVIGAMEADPADDMEAEEADDEV